jgi:hypothetical protein
MENSKEIPKNKVKEQVKEQGSRVFPGLTVNG